MKTTCSTCEDIALNAELDPDGADQWCITCNQQDGCKICIKGHSKRPVSEAELIFQNMNDFVQDISQDIFQQMCEQLKNQLYSKLSVTSSNRSIELKIAGKTYEAILNCQIRCKENDTQVVKDVERDEENKHRRVNRFLRKKIKT